MISPITLETININIKNAIGNKNNHITIVAITKGLPEKAIISAEKNGLYNIGESRVQETETKKRVITNKITTHFIGRLQKNKVRKATHLYNIIQTVNSVKLAQRINTICDEINKKQKIYLQVNIGKDINKQGFLPEKILEESKKIKELPNIIISGIMMIPPYTEINNTYRDYHKKTKEIQETIFQSGALSCLDVSMGMSRDYEIAIEEGATHIRLGTALFGERPN